MSKMTPQTPLRKVNDHKCRPLQSRYASLSSGHGFRSRLASFYLYGLRIGQLGCLYPHSHCYEPCNPMRSSALFLMGHPRQSIETYHSKDENMIATCAE
jgi:hypothetical protein